MNENTSKEESLANAINANDFESVKKLIKEGADVNYYGGVSSYGDYLARAIASKKDFNIIELLVKSGADVNKFNGCYSPLTHAIGLNHFNTTSLLLDNGANPNIKMFGGPILAHASSHGHTKDVKLLLEAGADPNLKGKMDFMTYPVSEAITNGNLECTKLLVEYGAKLNKTPVYNAACAAAEKCDYETLEYLVNKCKFKVMPAKNKDKKPASILHYAVKSNCIKLVSLLVKAKVDLEYIPNFSPFYREVKEAISSGNVLSWARYLGHEEIVTILLEAGADPNNRATVNYVKK